MADSFIYVFTENLVYNNLRKQTLTTDFYIPEKPIEFIKKLADTEVGEIPGTATLECELSQEGVPVKWYRDNTVLTPSNKYKMIDEGTVHKLEISDIDGEDEGKYSVIAKGQKSEASLFVEGNLYCFIIKFFALGQIDTSKKWRPDQTAPKGAV